MSLCHKKTTEKTTTDSKGFDIESIWKAGTKICDKFIEVKGRKWNEDSFLISDTELEIAKEKGDDYVIYFWKNVYKYLKDDCNADIPLEIPMVFRNPIKTLKIERCNNCLSYEIKLSQKDIILAKKSGRKYD